MAQPTPYTPTFPYNELTLAAVSGVPSGPLNSRYGPWTSNLDLKATKGFAFGGLDFEAFAWMLNAFNTPWFTPVTGVGDDRDDYLVDGGDTGREIQLVFRINW